MQDQKFPQIIVLTVEKNFKKFSNRVLTESCQYPIIIYVRKRKGKEMKKYTLEYRSMLGEYCAKPFEAKNDITAQMFARNYIKEHWAISCVWIVTFHGRYIPVY